MSRPVRRALVAVTLLVAGTGTLAAAAAPAEGAAPVVPAMTNIRTGLNTSFDRVVLDLTSGPAPAVGYQLTDELTADPSREIVWLTGRVLRQRHRHPRGRARRQREPHLHRAAEVPDAEPRQRHGRRRHRGFEGHLSVGLGVRSRTTVHVFTLTAPNRVVIDVAQ